MVSVGAALCAAGRRVARHEARALLAAALGVERTELLADPHREIDPRGFEALLARREAGEPLQLILGHTEFWSLTFEVSPATLIPRADSETLVEAALREAPGAHGRALDLGTGTGCLLLGFLSERPGWFGVGCDLAPEAATLARRNAVTNGLSGRAAFLAGCWGEALGGGFDLVLGNPPYIGSAEMAGLDPEVRDWEPARALHGGEDGLAAYRAIFADLPRLLLPGGAAVIEIGFGQDGSVPALAAALGLTTLRTAPDLAGIPRALVLRAG